MRGSHGNSFDDILTMQNMPSKCFDSLRKNGMTGTPHGNHSAALMAWNAGQPQTKEKPPKTTLVE